MNKHKMLTSVIAQAIFTAQSRDLDPVAASEEAAKAFAAGLAAFYGASQSGQSGTCSTEPLHMATCANTGPATGCYCQSATCVG